MKEDLNRILSPDRMATVFSTEDGLLEDENLEAKELITVIQNEIQTYAPDQVIILDLHSTSATGGIFVIVSDDPESVRIGTALHAPVILDFSREIKGTTLGYFNNESLKVNCVSVVFESGQHQEPLSVNRATSAIINCMRTIGSINPEDVENKHDALLKKYAEGLPKIARMVERYGIAKGSQFTLVRPFKNFEPIVKGEIVAYDGDVPVVAKNEGLILLPRMQDQGDDGFFLVEPVLL
jgi:succinylglutamate desuccinylase